MDVSLREGTLTFRVKAGKLDWTDGKRHVLFDLPSKEGRLTILKDSDNCLKFIHRLKEESVVQTSVSNLDPSVDHHIAATWDINKGICLYVDGEKVAELWFKPFYIG
jgi:hypothetical protein